MNIGKRLLWLFCLAFVGCDSGPMEPESKNESTSMAAPSRRIDIPSAVRRNLGISFLKVERRAVARTLRIPGRFELTPRGRFEYHAPLVGRIELLVDQYQTVEKGDPLFRIDSTQWRELQQHIAQTRSMIDSAEAKLLFYEQRREAHQDHEEELRTSRDLWESRVEQLEEVREAGGGRNAALVAAQAELASSRASLAEVLENEVEIEATRMISMADLRSAQRSQRLHLKTAARLCGESIEALLEENEEGVPKWSTIDDLVVRALDRGLVDELQITNGAWLNESSRVLSTLDPTRMRFRAQALQSDLPLMRDGMAGSVVPPQGDFDIQQGMSGTIRIGLSGHPEERTIDVIMVPESFAPWAKPGIAAYLEIVLEGTSTPELAIPLSAVQRDGSKAIFFRRDPNDLDVAIRIDADLGLDDGRWVVVKSGLMDGDEIVLDGAYQLRLATSTQNDQKGGHFHADGTWHEGEH